MALDRLVHIEHHLSNHPTATAAATMSMPNGSGPNGSSSSKSDPYGAFGPFGPAFQIIPGVQKYDWGILGKEGSLVAVYGEATEQLGLKVQDEKPYAEVSWRDARLRD